MESKPRGAASRRAFLQWVAVSGAVSGPMATACSTTTVREKPNVNVPYPTARNGRLYQALEENLAIVRRRVHRPLTLAEKLLFAHACNPNADELTTGKGTLDVWPDRVVLHDALGQTAMLQFMQSGLARMAVPSHFHCDHLIEARRNGGTDLQEAIAEHDEVFAFLRSSCARYGAGFWPPGAGISHQVSFERYAFPGALIAGGDSHTPNSGGIGACALAVGGAEAAELMAGLPWAIPYPRRIGVVLAGRLSGWATPKDIVLHLLSALKNVPTGAPCILEYLGSGTSTLSCTGKGTLANMSAELGVASSLFPYDAAMGRFLSATGRASMANLADAHLRILTHDPEVEARPADYFDRVLEIDLARIAPSIAGPRSPRATRTIDRMPRDVFEGPYPDTLSAVLIGSCTNSSYEDMSAVAALARQARRRGLQLAVPLFITPGSEQIRATLERDGVLATFQDIGATVLANACGPCIGRWRRDLPKDKINSIVTTFNRNYPGRNDGHTETLAFLTSPALAIAFAFAGRLTFNPLTDSLTAPDGSEFRFIAPGATPEVPKEGYTLRGDLYVAPPQDGSQVRVAIHPDSERLEILDPWPAWDGQDVRAAPVLLKVSGPCTTDHISPAGPWLRFRGHLSRLSENLFSAAKNTYTGTVGTGLDILTKERGKPFAQTARNYKSAGIRWVVIGDGNYGEGSSREHAALSPRFLGAAAVVARGFARIHECNLKKQGVLALTFSNPADYDRVREDDRVNILGLRAFAPGIPLLCVLDHADGSYERFELTHSYSASEVEGFKAGSAMNLLRTQTRSASQSWAARTFEGGL